MIPPGDVSGGQAQGDLSAQDDSFSRLLDEVARAVSLQEGAAGVHQVMRAFRRLGATSTRLVSREAGLPTPVVAAISNELRARGLVTRDRPSTLTPRGLELVGEEAPDLKADVTCSCCDGYGLVAGRLDDLAGQLASLIEQAPAVDLTLDQSHCTAQTKVRRILFMLRHGLLPARSMLLVGDDDLMALAIALASSQLSQPLVPHLAVTELAGDVLDFQRDHLAALGAKADLVQHDLRSPLPERLVGRFDLAMTDPPYTADGARLFLSRAVEALRPGPGQAIVFSFGAKGPGETLRVQRSVHDLGLSVQELHRDFNEYHGAGVLGGRSNLYLLATTEETEPVIAGAYAGPLYTADARGRDRVYLCVQCKSRHVVGPTARWRTIAELSDLGCPACGGHRLRPLQLAPHN